MRGKIVKGIAGFYYVDTGDEVYVAKARGVFKNTGLTPMVGDDVEIEITHAKDKEAVINHMLPRKNSFIRPPICNIDMIVVTVAAARPKVNYDVLDKFLVMAECKDVEIILCVNKPDLAKKHEIEKLYEIYGNIYPIYKVSGNTGEGINLLKKAIKGKTVAFAGASGVGKSTILNWLKPDANVEIGKTSSKTGRGRHTTRHVEIFNVDGSLVYDTPGFTSFDISMEDEDELAFMFPEMATYIPECKFDNCRHLSEPDCKVREAVEKGKISKNRYDSYISQLKAIREKNCY